MTQKSIYLDYAAATPLDPAVLAVMQPFFAEQFYNPSALYLNAQYAKKELHAARSEVAEVIGARPSEVVFTAGGTEANNLAVQGVMRRYPDTSLVVLEIEHDSVLEPAKQFQRRTVKVSKDGLIGLDHLRTSIDDTTVLVSVGYVNSEIGTIQPLREVRNIIEEKINDRLASGNELPLLLHTDACQAGNFLPLQVHKLGADLMTVNGGKVYGPKQSGALYVRAGVRLEPLIYGGGQENSRRSGTENIAQAVGLARALSLAQERRIDSTALAKNQRDYFIKRISEVFPAATINGSLDQRAANNVHASFLEQDNERLLMELDERGVMCAVGSACSASKDEPSHVLRALGLSAKDAQASLRFTLGRGTSIPDIDYTIDCLQEILSAR